MNYLWWMKKPFGAYCVNKLQQIYKCTYGDFLRDHELDAFFCFLCSLYAWIAISLARQNNYNDG